MIYLINPGDQKDNIFLKKNKNANDTTSDLCGNFNIVGENATMGQSRASENTEGENSNEGESVGNFKVMRAVRWWEVVGGNHLVLVRVKLLRICWTLKLKKPKLHKTN